MRILVSDYSGHAFPVQLSRALAARGHRVCHVSAASFPTPKGRLATDAADPAGFASVQVQTRRPFAKDSFVRRRSQEIELGKAIAGEIARFAPDVVISGNVPLDAQRYIRRAALGVDAAFVFWVQDLYSDAIGRILRSRLGMAGGLIGRLYAAIEARLLRSSDHVVVIAPAFVTPVQQLSGVSTERITTIPNWAPIDELPRLSRENAWVTANLAAAPMRLVYSGTLGFKHNPELIAAIARALPVRVEVFSEGAAAEALAATAAREQLNLAVRGWLPFADLPAALAGADLLLVILEPDAGEFSVPSKVLTYLAAGRPILGAMPRDNLAAQLIEQNGAGLVVAPDDLPGLIAAGRRLIGDPDLRMRAGDAGRAYAERTFAIEDIADRFEAICTTVERRR